MTDVRKIPWRLPTGYEDLKYFWDEFIKKLGVDLDDRSPIRGAGSPEGAVTAPVGALYVRTDGSAGATLYVKESGSGNTGWAAK